MAAPVSVSTRRYSRPVRLSRSSVILLPPLIRAVDTSKRGSESMENLLGFAGVIAVEHIQPMKRTIPSQAVARAVHRHNRSQENFAFFFIEVTTVSFFRPQRNQFLRLLVGPGNGRNDGMPNTA